MPNLYYHNPDKADWEEIKVTTRLSTLKNTVTLSANTNNLYIGVANYNPAEDNLIVIKDKGVLQEGIHYTFNTSSLKIFSKDGSDWLKDSSFTFMVQKNVNRTLPVWDGSLLQPGSITDSALASGIKITPALRDLDGKNYDSLSSRLLKIDGDIKDIKKQTPFIFVTDYEKDVVNLGTTTEDWTNAIQNALNAQPIYKQVILPMKRCRITKTITIPVGTSVIGFGNSSIIEADFGYWKSNDYRAIYIATREGINYEENTYNQYFENFSVIGKNNETIESIGIDISAKANINMAVAVNFSLIFGHLRNILVSRFDTAFNISEAWMTTFDSLSVLECRIGFKITGKSVNNTFNKLMTTNFSKDYTSNTGKRYGVYVDYKTTYIDGKGRPEGLFFANSLIFGADTCLYIKNVLYSRFTDLLLDGASEDVVMFQSPDNLTLTGCYIHTSGDGFSGVKFLDAEIGDSMINVTGNYFIGVASNLGTQYGVISDTTPRYNLTIKNNFFEQLKSPIYLNRVNKSKILNNVGRANKGDMIYCQSDCEGTIIDGNTSTDNYPILRLHPTTSKDLVIGKNKSNSTRTYYQSVTTVSAGSNLASAGNAFYWSELYIRAITLIQPLGNLGNVWVQAESTGSEATVRCSQAPTVDTKVYYTTIAVPYSATV